mmetsp:Transcript_1387/g.5269  ORF Transcript_1387/g.5269 Transcript_1387/m.5269 type:complete len:351 (-) Transcript_1387:132-1184(-)
MAKRNASRNSGKRTPQKASSLAVNTSKKMDRNSVVAGCVARKNRRPRARNPPASSPASPEKSKSPEKSPGRPRVRVSSPSSKRKKVSRARREKSSQVTAERSAGLKRSAGGPPRPPTATAGFTDSTITSPAKKIRSKRDEQARASPRRSDVKDENAKKLNDKLSSKLSSKLKTVTNGRVAKKKARRVRFKTAPGAPINSTQKIIHHYNNRRRSRVVPASSLASPRLSRHAGAVALERLLEGQIDVYGTHLKNVRRSARLTPSRASSPARSMIFSPMRGDFDEATPGREEWYADNLPAEVFGGFGGGEQKGREEEYDEWVDGTNPTPPPRPEYLTSPRVQWTPQSPASHRA